jgi:hypothetical protein
VEDETAWEDQDLPMGGYMGENLDKSEYGEERMGDLLSACFVLLMKPLHIFSLIAPLLIMFAQFYSALLISLFSLEIAMD